jgi:hypothetical protein
MVEAARSLSDRKEIVFCFVGGGSEQVKVKDFAALHKLTNVRCLPYQDFDRLSATLSAADLHVIVMGNEFVGIVHPSKLYNILTVGSPFLYIGPSETHVTEIAAKINGESGSYTATHGDVGGVVKQIMEAQERSNTAERRVPKITNSFSQQTLLPRMIELLECQVVAESETANKSRSASCVPAAR